jgi:hypothetical protein
MGDASEWKHRPFSFCTNLSVLTNYNQSTTFAILSQLKVLNTNMGNCNKLSDRESFRSQFVSTLWMNNDE